MLEGQRWNWNAESVPLAMNMPAGAGCHSWRSKPVWFSRRKPCGHRLSHRRPGSVSASHGPHSTCPVASRLLRVTSDAPSGHSAPTGHGKHLSSIALELLSAAAVR
eukprot:3687090-Rhodomonas_salina.3